VFEFIWDSTEYEKKNILIKTPLYIGSNNIYKFNIKGYCHVQSTSINIEFCGSTDIDKLTQTQETNYNKKMLNKFKSKNKRKLFMFIFWSNRII